MFLRANSLHNLFLLTSNVSRLISSRNVRYVIYLFFNIIVDAVFWTLSRSSLFDSVPPPLDTLPPTPAGALCGRLK